MKAKVILAAVGATALLAALWFFALWSPQSKNLEKANEERIAAEQQASELSARLNRLQRIEKNMDVLEENRAALAALIPDGDQLDTFLLDVNKRAADAGVSFVSVAPTPPVLNDPQAAVGAPAAIPLQIQVTGDYFAVMRFMEQLRDGPRLVTVEQFGLTGGDGGLMTASIGGRMYLSPPDAATPAPAPATTPSA